MNIGCPSIFPGFFELSPLQKGIIGRRSAGVVQGIGIRVHGRDIFRQKGRFNPSGPDSSAVHPPAAFTATGSVWLFDFSFLWSLIPSIRMMRFLFVRPRICLQLPSDSPSPETPLLFGYVLPTTGRARVFHPLDCAHAGRTKRARCRTYILQRALRFLIEAFSRIFPPPAGLWLPSGGAWLRSQRGTGGPCPSPEPGR